MLWIACFRRLIPSTPVSIQTQIFTFIKANFTLCFRVPLTFLLRFHKLMMWSCKLLYSFMVDLYIVSVFNLFKISWYFFLFFWLLWTRPLKLFVLIQLCMHGWLFRTLDRTISTLEMQLASARSAQGSSWNQSPASVKQGANKPKQRNKAFFVMGIITAFSSRRRRDSIRQTWMPQGACLSYSSTTCHHEVQFSCHFASLIYRLFLKLPGETLWKLEVEKGIIMRFVIGHR